MVFPRLQRGEEMDELEPGPLTLSVAPMNRSDGAPGKSQGAGEGRCRGLWKPGARYPEKKCLKQCLK